MNRSEELRAKLRTMFIAAWAGWTAEERARLLAKLPQYQREGIRRMIEEHTHIGD